MRNALLVTATLVAATLWVAAPARSQQLTLCRLLGLDSCFGSRCGNACGDCGCEVSCGCASGCGSSGRQYGGLVWEGCGCDGCMTNDHCCTSYFYGNSCQQGCGCGCGSACGCGATCDGEPSCGCSTGNCGRGGCCVCRMVRDCLFGCNGCGELYWCEWANDPPRCCEPCDRFGHWAGGCIDYRAPYAHPCGLDEGVPYVETDGDYVSNTPAPCAAQPSRAYAVNRPQRPNSLPTAQRSVAKQMPQRMATPAPLARRPAPPTNRSYQR